MNAYIKKAAPFAAIGCFLLSSPLLPDSLSMFWHPWISLGPDTLWVAVSLCAGLAVYGVAVAKLSSRASSVSAFLAVAAYAVCSLARLLFPNGAVYFALSCASVALSVAVFSVWLRNISRLNFREAIFVSACSIAAAYVVALLGIFGIVDSAVLYAAFAIAGTAAPFAWTLDNVAHGEGVQGRFSSAKAWSDGSDEAHAMQAQVAAIAAECCSGLYLFVMSSIARSHAFEVGAIPLEYRMFEMLALPLGALFVLALLLVKRGRVDLSQVRTEYLPIFAALFFVLSSFGAETPLFGVGYVLSQAALGALAVLAIPSIASLWSKGEASIVVLACTVLGGLLVALVVGQVVAAFVEPARVGALLLVIASIYFSGVMLSALSSLRTLIENMAHSAESDRSPNVALARSVDVGQVCDALTAEAALSPREREILQYVASGHTSPYIASKLVISEYTVRTHMRNMYRKIGVSSKEELIQLVEARRSEI